jgi:hypothetical protein
VVVLGSPRLSAADGAAERMWFGSLLLDNWRSGGWKREWQTFDNPYLRSRPVGGELGRWWRGSRWERRLSLEQLFPASVGFDDGTGRNRTIDQGDSRRSSTLVEGSLWRIWGKSRWRFGVGPVLRLGYERTTLDYVAIETRRRWGIGLDVGPSLLAEWRVRAGWRARAEVDNCLLLPWLSYARLSSPVTHTSAASAVARSRLSLSLSHTWKHGQSIELIYRREERIGIDQGRGEPVLDFEHNYPLDTSFVRDDHWMLRFGIRR